MARIQLCWGDSTRRRDDKTSGLNRTIVATQHNPRIRAFYQQLLKRGKTKMVALIAAMRKLLVILNVMARTQQPWRNSTQHA